MQKGLFSGGWRYCRSRTTILLKMVKTGSYLPAVFCQKKDASKKELYSWLIIHNYKVWKLEQFFVDFQYNPHTLHRRRLRPKEVKLSHQSTRCQLASLGLTPDFQTNALVTLSFPSSSTDTFTETARNKNILRWNVTLKHQQFSQ